ncbi:hypothetical protein [Methanospirillum lacunae]
MMQYFAIPIEGNADETLSVDMETGMALIPDSKSSSFFNTFNNLLFEIEF